MQKMKTGIEYFNQLVKDRRSVFPKQFVPGKAVDNNIIQQIMDNATWAPNHGNAEPWLFTVFSGVGLQTFAGLQSELYKKEAGENFVEAKYIKLQQQPLLASHVIAIGMKRTVTKRIPETEDIEAVSCAVQNIYLSVVAGPSFISGQTLLGIKPSFGFYFTKTQRWTGKVSYINVFNRTRIAKEDFGSLSLAIGLKLF